MKDRKRENPHKLIRKPALLLLAALIVQLLLSGCSAAIREPEPPPAPEPAVTEEEAETEAVIVADGETIPHYDPSMRGDEGWVQANGALYYLEGGGPVTGLRLIDGKYYYFDERGVKAAAVGIDVSTYNEEIDWERVREQGIGFAIIRLGGRGWTSGKIYPDLRCGAYLRGAKKAGLRVGAYFYSTARNEAEAAGEAEAVLKVLGGLPLELPVFIDLELSGEYPKGRADGLSASERSAAAEAFCRRIESAGYRAGVYSGQYYLHSSLDAKALSRYAIWLASYTKDGFPPRFRVPFSLWQFTDRGSVDGVRSRVDMNVLLDGAL